MRDETILKLFRPGTWIRLPVTLLHRLSSQEVIVLAETINQSVVTGSDVFFYSVEEFENRTGFNADAQKRALKKLSDQGILRLGKAGLPARRTIEIVWDGLSDLLADPQLSQGNDPQLSQGNDPQLSQDTVSADPPSLVRADPPGHTIHGKKHIKKSPTGFVFGAPEEKTTDRFDEIASRMYDVLAQKRKIFRPPNLTSWAKTFRDFCSKSGYSSEELSSTLDDYLEMIDLDFAPLAFSAETFVSKWNNVTAFVNRSKKRASSAWDSV